MISEIKVLKKEKERKEKLAFSLGGRVSIYMATVHQCMYEIINLACILVDHAVLLFLHLIFNICHNACTFPLPRSGFSKA